MLVRCLLTLVLVSTGCGPAPPDEANGVLRLGTTTSTRDSGLLDALLPEFEARHSVRVDVIAAGTGKALRLAEAGDVDVVLVHARPAEDAFMAAGHGVRRVDVMYNAFEILGPAADEAGITGLAPGPALRRIAERGARFVSRADDSGTHKRELELWDGDVPRWPEYIETGQGMGRALIIADQMWGYVLTDHGTYLAFKDKIELVPLVAGYPELRNPYGAMAVHPDKSDQIDAELCDALLDYLVAPATQARIAGFRVSGEPLFHPAHP